MRTHVLDFGEWSDKRIRVKCLGSPICEISISRGLSDQRRHTTVDIVEGKMLEFRVYRGKGMKVYCSLESQKPKARVEKWHIPDVGATWMKGGVTTTPRKR
jgi:hypothetical protein